MPSELRLEGPRPVDPGTTAGAPLEVRVAPGYPTCHACRRGLLQVRLPSPGHGPLEANTHCTSCGDQARYPTQALAGFPGVVAVIAPSQRLDRPHVRLESALAGGAVALLCPRCGAPLDVDGHETTECAHCSCTSYVPVRARRPHQQTGDRRADPFFVAFTGRSARRAELEQATGTLTEPRVDKAAAIAPQILLSLLAAGVALALAFVLVWLTGVVDVL